MACVRFQKFGVSYLTPEPATRLVEPVEARLVSLGGVSLPAGTVTLLFSDIEGSTRLLQQLADDYAAVEAEHRRVMRESCTGAGGHEIEGRALGRRRGLPRARRRPGGTDRRGGARRANSRLRDD